jgi:NitT/TauT family transport system ATP-binding protein
MTGAAGIRFDNVWKEYANQIVLESISIDIAPRAFLALVGPSGCGKSTFLKLLLGSEAPTKGQITINGVALKAEPSADRGVVFQKYSVFPHLDCLGNVTLARELDQTRWFGKLFGVRKKAAEEEASALLAKVGLAGKERAYPSALSGGMQQRLALAQAIFNKPRVLLLDEPFGALDPGIRADIRELVKQLWRENDVTIVMVTHDLSEAFELATRVIAFERKRNRPEEYDRYGAKIAHDHEIFPPRNADPQTLIDRGFLPPVAANEPLTKHQSEKLP